MARENARPPSDGRTQDALEMKLPSFPFYPADYLADMRVRLLSWASRGLYVELLCYCWREGWIPSDSSAIAQLCGCHDSAIIDPCLMLFSAHPSDSSKLIHEKLEGIRSEYAKFRKERAESGMRGAKARWSTHKEDGSANGSAIKEPMAKACLSPSPSPSPSPSLSSSNNNTGVPSGESDFTLVSTEPAAPRESKSTKAKATLEEVKAYAVERGFPESDGEGVFDAWEATGWKINNQPMRDWKAAFRTRQTGGWLPSQKSSGGYRNGNRHAQAPTDFTNGF